MSRISIEIAESEDAEVLANISKRAFDSDVQVGAPGPGGPDGYDSAEHQRGMIQDASVEYLKILYDDRIVGGTCVYRVNDLHHEIFNVFIDPDFHRRGIGSQSFALIRAKYPQVKKWTLDTPVWNTRTQAYYEGLGFVQYGIFRWVPAFDLRAYHLLLDPEYKDKVTRIADATDTDRRYLVQGVVEHISDAKEVLDEDDTRHRVAEITIKDDSSSVRLVLRDGLIRQVRMNEFIQVAPVQPSFRDGEVVLSLLRGGRIAILNSDQ